MSVQRYSLEIGGRTMTLETGRQQAGGAVLVTYGETVVLATATSSSEPREGIVSLQVEFEEKTYAAGQVPGRVHQARGAAHRAGHPDGAAHRPPLRPLFPKDYRNDVQVVVTVSRRIGSMTRPSARSSAPRRR